MAKSRKIKGNLPPGPINQHKRMAMGEVPNKLVKSVKAKRKG